MSMNMWDLEQQNWKFHREQRSQIWEQSLVRRLLFSRQMNRYINFSKHREEKKHDKELLPDEGAEYDERIEINLSELEPLISCPHQPDNVIPLKDVERKPVQQVFIGSCTNTSYADVAKAALVFQGRQVNENVSCTCGIASRQTYKELLRDGYIDMLIDAGVRILEIACGPCCAIGQTPATEGIAVRTSNRNFKGRAGNPTAKIYLVSPESAAATRSKELLHLQKKPRRRCKETGRDS